MMKKERKKNIIIITIAALLLTIPIFLLIVVFLVIVPIKSCFKYKKITYEEINKLVYGLVDEKIILEEDILIINSGKKDVNYNYGSKSTVYFSNAIIAIEDYLIEINLYCTDLSLGKDFHYFFNIYKSVKFEEKSPVPFLLDNHEVRNIIDYLCIKINENDILNYNTILHYFDEDYLINNFDNNSYLYDEINLMAKYNCELTYDISYALYEHWKSNNVIQDEYSEIFDSMKQGCLVISFYIGYKLEGLT